MTCMIQIWGSGFVLFGMFRRVLLCYPQRRNHFNVRNILYQSPLTISFYFVAIARGAGGVGRCPYPSY